MLHLNRISKKRLSFSKPDHTEQREARYLLVWKDIPHWMVVDDEFYHLLSQCRGDESFQDVYASCSGNRRIDRALSSSIRHLISLGILRGDIAAKEQSKSRVSPSVPLENIAINVTSRCNLRCSFCYNRDGLSAGANGELTAQEIMSFLDTARPILSKSPSLALVGGEPLECPDKVIEVASYAIRRGFSTLVSTNGTKVTDEFARKAKETGLEVQVSIDGHNADLIDPLRGKGVFEMTRNGIRTLVANGVYTIMCAICHADNFEHIESFYALARSLGVNEARFIPLKRVGGGVESPLRIVPIEAMLKKAVSVFAQNRDFRSLSGRDCFTIIANTCRFSNKRSSCGTGLQTLLLDSDGTIYPCLNTNVDALRVANVREAGFDLLDTWDNSPVLKDVRQQTAIDNPDNECSQCLVRYWCLGGCRGETYATKGSLDARACNCGDLRKSIIEMFWILADNSDWIKSAAKIC